MSNDEFVQPGAPGGDPLDLNALLGSLLVLEVKETIEHVNTVHTLPGEKTPAVRADVHVLDGSQQGLTREDALVFPRVLQGQLRGNVGKKVLGRLRKGQPTPGRSAPWELAPATQDDMQAAQRWAASRSMTSAAAPGAQAPF